MPARYTLSSKPFLRGLCSAGLAAWLVWPTAAAAATVYRCGAIYQDKPCGEGQTELNTGAPLSAQEQAQAYSRAQSEANLAQQLVQERRQREREQQANAQTEAVGLSQPHTSLSQDDSLTDCKRPPTAKVRWSKRKQEYCAEQKLSPPKRRSNH